MGGVEYHSRPMSRVVQTLRLDMLFFSVPYTFVWARALGGAAEGPVASGALLVGVHGAALLLALLLSDTHEIEQGREPRLSLLRDRFEHDEELRWGAAPILTLIVGALTLVLLVAEPLAGLASIVVVGALLWHARRPMARKYVGLEVFGPLLLLALPGALVWWRLSGGGGTGAASAMGASALGAAGLGLYVLLCMARDEPYDRAEGVRTIAVGIGRGGARTLALAWAGALVLMASMGAGWGWWGWGVPAFVGVGAMGAASSLAAKRDGRAVGVWAVMHALAAVALAASAG